MSATDDETTSPLENVITGDLPQSTMPVTMSAAEEALAALRLGIQPIPVPFGSKNPRFPGWQNLIISEVTFEQHFDGSPTNVGFLNGEISGNLVDIDLDDPMAVALADRFLPPTGCIFGRRSKPRSHWMYRTDRALPSSRCDDPASSTKD